MHISCRLFIIGSRLYRSGVGVSAKVNDASGSMSFLLCRVPLLNDRAVIDEIRNAVRQRQLSV